MNLQKEPRLFTLLRNVDESGVSGTGRVLDGVTFHTGQVVVCWRSDITDDSGYSSIAIYPSWEAFMHVHVNPHPQGAMEIKFVTDMTAWKPSHNKKHDVE